MHVTPEAARLNRPTFDPHGTRAQPCATLIMGPSPQPTSCRNMFNEQQASRVCRCDPSNGAVWCAPEEIVVTIWYAAPSLINPPEVLMNNQQKVDRRNKFNAVMGNTIDKPTKKKAERVQPVSRKHDPAVTLANKQANVARDLKQKAEKAARKAAQVDKRRAEFDAWQADIAKRNAKVVALPDRHARQVVRAWQVEHEYLHTA